MGLASKVVAISFVVVALILIASPGFKDFVGNAASQVVQSEAMIPNLGEKCEDTDASAVYPNGINIYKKGAVIEAGKDAVTDRCFDKENVIEHFCNSNKTTEAVTIFCGQNAKCSDGRCKNKLFSGLGNFFNRIV